MRFDLHVLGKPDETGHAPTLKLRMLDVPSLDEAVQIAARNASQAEWPEMSALKLFDEGGNEVYRWPAENGLASPGAPAREIKLIEGGGSEELLRDQ
jgi:hypothetical protein